MEQYKCAKARVAACLAQLKELQAEASMSGLGIDAAEFSIAITALNMTNLEHAQRWDDSFFTGREEKQ